MNARLVTFAAAAAVGYALARPPVRYSFRGRVVVITGGSRGLGLLLARELAREGARLVLLARDAEELRRAERELRARGATVLSLTCDVRRRHEARAAIEETVARLGRLDVLVNNAGEMDVGPLEHMHLEDFDAHIAIHLRAPLHTTLLALPHLARTRGRVVNIASIGGRLVVPHMAAYSVSKFALVGLSQALRSELSRRGVKVTTVCPGPMRTGSPPNARFRGRPTREYAWFAILAGLPVVSTDAERVARRIVAACRQGRAHLTTPWTARAAEIVAALAPDLSARGLELMTALLPAPRPGGSDTPRTGWESTSRLAPSILTRLSDRATRRNNEAAPARAPGHPERRS